jgi:hypothetical protein
VKVVKPAEILAAAGQQATAGAVAEQVLRRTNPPGTPFSKTRYGLVTTYDVDTWTCTAQIGDASTSIAGIPMLGGVMPAVNAYGMFAEVTAGSKTEYTLVGMLMGGPMRQVIRTPADQTMTNSLGPNLDGYLKFKGLAGRTYLYRAVMLVSENTINDMDVKFGWSLPSGATFSGGGIGPIQSIAAGSSLESTGAGANWRGVVGASGFMLQYGVEVSTANGTYGPIDTVLLAGSIKMGAVDGTCNLTWGQRVNLTATTKISQGSTLQIEMTSEYTL